MKAIKTALIASLIVSALTGCAQQPDQPKTAFDLQFDGSATMFTESHALSYNQQGAIENSLVNFNGKVLAFFDPNMNGDFFKAELGSDGKSFIDQQQITSSVRFPYTLVANNSLYNFGSMNGDIYLWKSTDGGNSWALVNNGQPVLHHSSDPNSIYNQVWNVGVAVDDNGTWHMLVECSVAGAVASNVGLAYSTATMTNDSIDFDSNRSNSQVIPKAGNPFLAFVSGKGLLAVHGVTADPTAQYGDEWFVSASTLATGSNTWIEHKNTFRIGTKGVHVCDPHLVELPAGGLMMTVSMNQDSISTAYAPGVTFSSMFNSVQ